MTCALETSFAGRAAQSIVTVFLSVSLGGTWACSSTSEGADPGSSEPKPARVKVASVQEGALDESWPLLGNVRTTMQAELAAGAAGQVRKITVREGVHVKKGQLLVQVDPSIASAGARAAAAELQQAREGLDQAERDAKRAETAGKELMATSEIERARALRAAQEARVDRLQATVQEARAQLSQHRVLAPFEGVVSVRHVDLGDWVQPGELLVELVASDDLEVIVQAPVELVRQVKQGDAVVLQQGEHQAPGTVMGVVPALEAATRTAKFRIAPDTPAPWLLPGLPVEVTMSVRREATGAVIVPRDALVQGAVETRVVRVKEKSAEPIVVDVVATSKDRALVRGEGLEPGHQVVTRGNERLRPGQSLQVAP